MGHGGETIVCSPQHHHSGNHQPQVGGPGSNKKPQSLTKVNISGGGICHTHDNTKGAFPSSKMAKKQLSHSTPQTHSKPINMGKTRQSHGRIEYQNSPYGNNANLVALQHFQQQQTPFQFMKQQSLTAHSRSQSKATTPRQKSYSPPTLHPMPSGEGKARTVSPVLPGSKYKEHFYAGARFETHPSHIGLPVPPSHWTAPRSQSQPASPVPTSLPQKGFSVDLATLFGYSDSAKSASFPGDRLLDALLKTEEERKKKQFHADKVSIADKCIGSLAQAQVNKHGKSNDETDELKKALGLANFTSPVKAATKLNNSGFVSLGSDLPLSPTKYQDISDQLKNLLKVAA